MRDLPGKALALFITCITLSGCYACSLNGGWEGQMNPFCVEKDALVGPISLPKSVATYPPDAQPIRSSTPALGGAEGSRTPDLVIANDALYQLSYGPDRQAEAGDRGRRGGVSTGRGGILGVPERPR